MPACTRATACRRPAKSTAARNVVRVSTVTRVGNRDVMRVRPFIRISGNLAMATSDLSAKIPPFNAQRMLTDVGAAVPAAAEDPNNPDAIEPDAEVSFVTKDLAPILPKAKLAAVVALDEVIMRVRDASNWRGNSGVRYTTLASATADASGARSDMKLAYATEGNVANDPYAGFETRVVPGKRHAAAEDQGSDHRRQSYRRARPCGQEGRYRHLDPARPGRHAGRGEIDRRHARAPAAATAG